MVSKFQIFLLGFYHLLWHVLSLSVARIVNFFVNLQQCRMPGRAMTPTFFYLRSTAAQRSPGIIPGKRLRHGLGRRTTREHDSDSHLPRDSRQTRARGRSAFLCISTVRPAPEPNRVPLLLFNKFVDA